MGILEFILSWYGGGPLASILKEVGQYEALKLKAMTEVDKAKIQERIAALHVQADLERARLADLQQARQNVSNLPWWAATMMVMIGMPFAIHVVLIGVGTWWVAPRDWDPATRAYDGAGWLEWTRHIPPFPPPFDTQMGSVPGSMPPFIPSRSTRTG